MQDTSVTETSSQLQQLITCNSEVNLEYVLCSGSKLLAFNCNTLKVVLALKKVLMKTERLVEDWKTIELCDCKFCDESFKEQIMPLLTERFIIYLESLSISHCNLTELSIGALTKVLEFCIIKKLTVSGNDTLNSLLHDTLLDEIHKESKICNFKLKVGLTILNKLPVGAAWESYYAARIYLVNCELSDTILSSLDAIDQYTKCEIFFLNNAIRNQEVVQRILMYCLHSSVTVSLFQSNLPDSILAEFVLCLS